MEQAEKVAAVTAVWLAAYDAWETGGCVSPSTDDLVKMAADAIGAVTTKEGRTFVADVFDDLAIGEQELAAQVDWIVAELEAV